VSWPIHSPASGPRALAATMTLTFVPAASTGPPGRSGRRAEVVGSRRPSILCRAVTTWSPQVVSTDATCGSVNTAAGVVR
jgi:hypothetical protein